MKKYSILLLTFGFLWLPSMAQRKMKQLDEEESKKQEQLKAYEKGKTVFDPSKMVYGGNVGAAINNNYTYILAQPLVGYKVLPKTIVGVGFTYIYQSFTQVGKTYTNNAYGPIVFARQSLIPQIFLHAEYQPINHQISLTERTWTNQLFVGGGLGSSGAQVYVLYDVLHSSQSLYASPWMIRIGFMF